MLSFLDRYNEALRAMGQTINTLQAENATLRQQRDAANAQLDFILENLSNESTRNSGKGS